MLVVKTSKTRNLATIAHWQEKSPASSCCGAKTPTGIFIGGELRPLLMMLLFEFKPEFACVAFCRKFFVLLSSSPTLTKLGGNCKPVNFTWTTATSFVLFLRQSSVQESNLLPAEPHVARAT